MLWVSQQDCKGSRYSGGEVAEYSKIWLLQGCNISSLVAINGLFTMTRSSFNVVREQSADPGFDDFFMTMVICPRCNVLLGVLLLRVDPQYEQEPWVAGNYAIVLNRVWIERGNFLFDAITRQVVGNI